MCQTILFQVNKYWSFFSDYKCDKCTLLKIWNLQQSIKKNENSHQINIVVLTLVNFFLVLLYVHLCLLHIRICIYTHDNMLYIHINIYYLTFTAYWTLRICTLCTFAYLTLIISIFASTCLKENWSTETFKKLPGIT